MTSLLLVEDKESLARMLEEALTAGGHDVDAVLTGSAALQRIASGRRYHAVLTDLRLPGADGIEVLRAVREADPDCPVLVMTAFGTIENAVEAMKLGAWDFVQKPIDVDYLLLLVGRCLEFRRLRFENLLLREDFQRIRGVPAIVGESAPMRAVSEQIQKVAATDSTVLLLGESGTGKELFARAVHHLSPRRDRPFVAVNCAAIPDTLIENELFGHEKGAYTGASTRQMGRFEFADGGTIFLDEIAELGVAVQSKILRVLQEKKFERVGGLATVSVDVRIVCATNRNLKERVKEGLFREDLFFRVNVFPITVPPLRARRADIDALAAHFLARYARDLKKRGVRISDEAMQMLRDYDWPGNVRELENCIERAVILCEDGVIRPTDLNIASDRSASAADLGELVNLSGTLAEASERAQELVERVKIAEALASSGSRQEAAEKLGIALRTLATKMKELGLE
jgi:DNA-binding NtrC family response regulator